MAGWVYAIAVGLIATGLLMTRKQHCIDTFINFCLAEIEEMNLEFNLKIAGKAGMPVLAEGSAEGSFKIQVKCKFPSEESEKPSADTAS